MEQKIIAKVRIDFSDPTKTEVVIRKAEFNNDGTVAAIYGLGKNGEWLRKTEGQPYPDECILPVAIYDNFSEIGLSFKC